ncbi:hypothetical protein GDS87_17505 [Lysinibacillus pakistanensis]|uniref:Uncharacterized protein n=2 Tax=Lysinibacillus pakistanensis TaxID=759811 RepID=A0ABX6DDA4_9BACI|nr:hypothetical protein GDS87_17505 [Lysinibacillus pakistanensis]
MAVTVLIAFMAFDYATGNMSGVINQNLNSRVGFQRHHTKNLLLNASWLSVFTRASYYRYRVPR